MTGSTATPDGVRLVFLVGAPRSGTTWLQSLLGADPTVVTPQETDLFSTFVAPLQAAWDEQVGRSADEQRARRTKGLPAVLSDADFEDLMATLIRRVLDRVHDLDPAATVIVEKSPSHSRHVDLIARYLPDAAFVHILRDGRDVAASLQAASKGWGSYWAPAATPRAARAWKESVLGARRAAATGRYTEVRYEDLRAGRTAPLCETFAACGIDLDDARAAGLLAEFSLDRMKDGTAPSTIALGGSMAERHDALREPAGFFGHGDTGGWRATWTDDDRLRFDETAGDLLVDLGYEPDHAWAGTDGERRRFARRGRVSRPLAKLGRRIGRRADRTLARLP